MSPKLLQDPGVNPGITSFSHTLQLREQNGGGQAAQPLESCPQEGPCAPRRTSPGCIISFIPGTRETTSLPRESRGSRSSPPSPGTHPGALKQCHCPLCTPVSPGAPSIPAREGSVSPPAEQGPVKEAGGQAGSNLTLDVEKKSAFCAHYSHLGLTHPPRDPPPSL